MYILYKIYLLYIYVPVITLKMSKCMHYKQKICGRILNSFNAG